MTVRLALSAIHNLNVIQHGETGCRSHPLILCSTMISPLRTACRPRMPPSPGVAVLTFNRSIFGFSFPSLFSPTKKDSSSVFQSQQPGDTVNSVANQDRVDVTRPATTSPKADLASAAAATAPPPTSNQSTLAQREQEALRKLLDRDGGGLVSRDQQFGMESP